MARLPDKQAAPEVQATEESQLAARQLGEVLKQLHRYVSSHMMQGLQSELTELDLSFSQMTALHYLRAHGATKVTTLSERTRLSLPAASHLVERLVQRGLAQREENPDNRRERLVTLTLTGRQMLEQLDEGFVDAYVQVFSRVHPDVVQAATQTLQGLLTETSSQSLVFSSSPLQEP